ncbi:MAG: DUF4097 domain-containing protein [Verrucomicrobiota bacterium]|nr:DUF4097 domain-containing protein [Verrucomicrobiota bacterium]
MNNFGRALAVVMFASLLLVGRAGAVEILEETTHETFEVEPGASFDISDTDGSIRIYAADVPEITVSAIKKAYTAERLQAIKVAIAAEPKSVSVSTTFPPTPSHWSFKDRSGTVEYTVIVPLTTHITKCELVNGEILVEGLRGGSAKAHLVNGWMSGHNCFGDLDVSIVNGKLDVAYDWWENKPFSAKAESMNGTIRALIPPDASLKITAHSANGHVVNALPAEDESTPRPTPSQTISLELGESSDRALQLSATNGNVRIDRAY